jgi:hypothetical protein
MDLLESLLIDNVEEALWKLQRFYNAKPEEVIPNYFGSCHGSGSWDTPRGCH